MKKVFTYILLVAFSFGTLYAQTKIDKIKEVKIAYFNKKLDFTPKEAEQFWKIYNQYEAEKWAVKKSLKKYQNKKLAEMSDQEIYEYIDFSLKSKEKEVALEKKYFSEFRKILPAQKVAKLLKIEEQFRKFLFNQMKNKRH